MLLSQKFRIFNKNIYRSLDIISPNDSVLISLSLLQYSDKDALRTRDISILTAKKLYISGTVVAAKLCTLLFVPFSSYLRSTMNPRSSSEMKISKISRIDDFLFIFT